MDYLNTLVNEVSEWADFNFGSTNPEKLISHLQEEMEELKEEPHSPYEMADVIMLVMNLAWYYNVDLNKAIREKLEINKSKSWVWSPVKQKYVREKS